MLRKGDLESYLAERDAAWRAKERALTALRLSKRRQSDRGEIKRRFNECNQAFIRARNRYRDARAVIGLEASLPHLLNEIPIDYEYGDIKLVRGRRGECHLYYGGRGQADGAGHGHVHMRKNGFVIYKRPPVKTDASHG